MDRKKVLYKHRITAFNATLRTIKIRVQDRKNFINEYGAAFNIPKRLIDEQNRELTQVLKAIKLLENYKV